MNDNQVLVNLPIVWERVGSIKLRNNPEVEVNPKDSSTFTEFPLTVKFTAKRWEDVRDAAGAAKFVTVQNGHRSMTPDEFKAAYPTGVIEYELGATRVARKAEPTDEEIYVITAKKRGHEKARNAFDDLDEDVLIAWDKKHMLGAWAPKGA